MCIHRNVTAYIHVRTYMYVQCTCALVVPSQSVGRSVSWSVARTVGGQMVGRLVGRLVGWSVSWSVGQLVSQSFRDMSYTS